jgi:hypothetical protein
MEALSGITEWRAPDFQHFPPVEIVLLAGLYILLSRGVTLAPLRLILLLVLVSMTLAHVRHETLLVLIGAPLMAEAIGRGAPFKRDNARAVDRIALGAAAAGMGLLFAVRLAAPPTPGDSPVAPVSALAHVPEALARQPVFNSYDLGGYLIFRGVKPFIDGRTDMYGDRFIARYDAVVQPDKAAFDQAARDYGIAWTLLAPSSPLVPVLEPAGAGSASTRTGTRWLM